MKLQSLAASVVALAALSPSASLAATLWVSPTGSSSTTGNAYNNIQNINTPATYRAALTLAQSGDTIMFKPGTYNQASLGYLGSEFAIPITKSNLKLIAQFPATTSPVASRTIIKPSRTFLWKVFAIDNKTDIEIRGFEMDGSDSGVHYNNNVDGAWPGGIDIVGESYRITIADNIVHDFDGAGIAIYNANQTQSSYGNPGGADYITTERNVIYNCCFWSKYETSAISYYGFYPLDNAPGVHNVIRGNIIYSNTAKYIGPSKANNAKHTDGNAIILDLQGVNAPITLIENNVLFNNGGRAVNVFKSSNAIVRNNSTYKNCQDPDVQDGELVANIARNVLFANNVAVGNGNRVTSRSSGSTGITFAYNVYADGSTVIMGTGDVKLTNSLSLYRNPATFDFRSKPGSPAIDTGTQTNLPLNSGTTPLLMFAGYAPMDIMFRPRWVGASVDKGAYEYIPIGR